MEDIGEREEVKEKERVRERGRKRRDLSVEVCSQYRNVTELNSIS